MALAELEAHSPTRTLTTAVDSSPTMGVDCLTFTGHESTQLSTPSSNLQAGLGTEFCRAVLPNRQLGPTNQRSATTAGNSVIPRGSSAIDSAHGLCFPGRHALSDLNKFRLLSCNEGAKGGGSCIFASSLITLCRDPRFSPH